MLKRKSPDRQGPTVKIPSKANNFKKISEWVKE